jgi:hypothetical protein
MQNKFIRTAVAAIASAIALGGIGTSARANLLFYDGFNYSAGEALGTTASGATGQTNTDYNVTWIGRQTGTSPAPANDSLITSGNLSYSGLAASTGNSVSMGRNATSTALATDSIPLPGGAVTSGTLYYSMLIQVKDITGLASRFAPASFDTGTSNTSDAGTQPASYSSTSNTPVPAGLWLRKSGSNFQFGAGKQNADGLGNSDGAAAWQAATLTSNQHGSNTDGSGQTGSSSTTYFVVMKYTFGSSNLIGKTGSTNAGKDSNQQDTVSIYINPVASTLGDDAGEATAATSAGSYYSATDAFAGLVNIDAQNPPGIQSFFLNQHSLATVNSTSLLAVDELRIGTTWADVTPPAPEPTSLAALGLGAGALLARRRRRR